jgi:hypothetical protein
MKKEILCSCGETHYMEGLESLIDLEGADPDDYDFEEIDCGLCPICNPIKIDPNEDYPELFDEEKYEVEDETEKLDEAIDDDLVHGDN